MSSEHLDISTPRLTSIEPRDDRVFFGLQETQTGPSYGELLFVVFGGQYEYALQKRIEEAKFSIAKQNTSFTDIAIRLGFCSQSHFNKLFKDRVHCTPKEYQEKALKLYFYEP